MTTVAPKILVVEDEIPMARALELKLTREGYHVTVAHNGDEGLQLIDEQPFDLILLDLIMPKTDGFTVLAKLKEKKVKMPIIVHSSLSQQEDIERVKQLGAAEYFTKFSTPLGKVIEAIQSTLKAYANRQPKS